ncbi:MAG: DNA polymerase III subunit delta [Treponema sp.]|jgi:DNA polymerase-3 subunit delta|nr:DNA polymerase III subunit delta [Treponema sp.]
MAVNAPAGLSAKEIEEGCCFLFLGPERGKKADAIADIRRDLAANGVPAEETVFYAGETPAAAIADVLRNGSLFADTRLFIVKNAEAIKEKEKEDIRLFSSCLKFPQPRTVLILVSDESRAAKSLEDAVPPPRRRRVFWELFENQKTEWVRDFFRREGCRIDEEGVAAILEMVENNTEALGRECSRLILFLGKNRTLSAADVEDWLSHSREESAFTLFSRIAWGDLSKSLESLHSLLGAKEEPVRILSGLVSSFRKLRDYEALADSGNLSDGALRQAGFSHPKARADFAEARRLYGPGGADRLLALAAEYDIRVRSGGGPLETLLMELFLYQITVNKRAGGAFSRPGRR